MKLRNGTIFTKTELSTIGTTLVSIFRHQAKSPTHPLEQKHFAVVYLTSSKEELLNLHQDGSIVTDNSYSLLPPDDQLTRYITARPDDRKCHAEDLIMKKFYKLVQVFDSEVKYIVLFTWLFPCRDCASKIATAVRDVFPKNMLYVTVVVIYCRIRPEEKPERKYVRRLLNSQRIHLRHIKF